MLITQLLIGVAAVGEPPLPVAPPPRAVKVQPGLPLGLADWTPRPATGKAEPWEKATDKDWIDGRFRLMDTGPFLNCSMDYPFGKGKERVYKATVIKLGHKDGAAVVFDRCTMQIAGGWAGGFLNHSDRRFGLLNTPTPKGEMLFTSPVGIGWANLKGDWDAKTVPFTAPLPDEWAKYRGLYLNGDRLVLNYTVAGREVLEFPTIRAVGGVRCLVRAFEVGPASNPIRVEGRHFAAPEYDRVVDQGKDALVAQDTFGLAIIGTDARHNLVIAGQRVAFEVPGSTKPSRFLLATWTAPAGRHDEVYSALRTLKPSIQARTLTEPGPKLWGEPIVTKLVRGEGDGPFAIDTLTIPYKNRFKALFFCTGLDFLPDGRVAVCTCHGDVWLVTLDEKAATCSWQRYATGLYHPLGLKVVDGKVIVLERGQLTRLHDRDGNGEADFYECVNNDWHTGGGEHSYDTCLETDPAGNFYFFKTGDTNTPSGGCLIRVSKDGKKSEIFCTGFRHPIGMGMSPTGILTGADQEGNWMPATRIDEYRQGGFYGDMRGHHRPTPPKLFDGPLCWLPRELDNSAGGQVWVPEDTFGPLAGLPLHFSYGRCRPFVLLRQPLKSGITQGGVTPLDVQFLSGVCRGRFHPVDGHLYVCGLNGWQTAAQADGCLQRVRYTGRPLDVPVAMKVEGNTVRLTFSRPLDAKAVSDPDRYRAAWWNYRWSGEYGSKRWKVSDPDAEGQDDVPIRGAKLLADRKTVEVSFDHLRPVMQMQVGYNLLAADGRKVTGSVFLTIHETGK